jgi:hypothetical protein
MTMMSRGQRWGSGSVVIVVLLLAAFFAYDRLPPYWKLYRAPERVHAVLERLDSYEENRDVLDRYVATLHSEVASHYWGQRRIRRISNQTASRTVKTFSQSRYNRLMVDGMVALAGDEERMDLYSDLLNLSIEMRP